MSLVTVIGASSQTFAVTVEGSGTYSLKRQFSNAAPSSWSNSSSNTISGASATLPVGSVNGSSSTSTTIPTVSGTTSSPTIAGTSSTPTVTTPTTPANWVSLGGAASEQKYVTTDPKTRTVTYGEGNPGYGRVTIQGVSSATVNDKTGYPNGHETIVFNTQDGTVNGGVYDTISAAGNLTTRDLKTTSLTVNGSLTFIGGTPRGDNDVALNKGGSTYGGINSITAGNATIYAASNGSYIVNATQSGGTTYLEQYQGATGVTFNASQSHQALDAWVGNKDVITGTKYGDTFHFGVPSDSLGGGANDQNWSSTVYGGSGDNIFDFVTTGGGHYTIADFSQSAGNKVELHGISQSTLDKDLANSKGSSTLKLDDGTQITFGGMTIGTNLTDKDFILK